MFRQTIAALMLLFTGSCTSAQPALPTETSYNSLLWEISGKGLARPSYILGTMHMLCEEDAYLSRQVMQILDLKPQVYLEADLNDMGQIFSAMKMMIMRNDTTLRDLYNDTDYEKVKTYFKENAPLPFMFLERCQPLMLSSMVAESSFPCKAQGGTEILLMKETNKQNLDVKGLETLEFQASLFGEIPYKQQAAELLEAIGGEGSSDSSKASMDSLLSAYRRQDLAAIEKLTLQDDSGFGGLESLLYKRNANWATLFDKIALEKATLFAVGAAHLAGSKGVLQLLQDKGYTIRPLKNEKGYSEKTL